MESFSATEQLPAAMARLSTQTRGLIACSIKRLLDDSSWRQDLDEAGCRPSHAERFHEVLLGVEQRYAESFVSMCEMLHPTPTTAYAQFAGVTSQLFKDKINWSRIATLVAFGAYLGKYFKENGMPDMVRSVIGWIQRLTDSDLIVWLHKQGGWEGFYNHYSRVSQTSCSSQPREEGEASMAALGIWTVAFGAFVYVTSN